MKQVCAAVGLAALGVLNLAGCSKPPPPPVAEIKPCAAGLSPAARKIYDAVQAGPTEGTLRDRISTQTRELVMDGDVTRYEARHSAEEAADCLRTP